MTDTNRKTSNLEQLQPVPEHAVTTEPTYTRNRTCQSLCAQKQQNALSPAQLPGHNFHTTACLLRHIALLTATSHAAAHLRNSTYHTHAQHAENLSTSHGITHIVPPPLAHSESYNQSLSHFTWCLGPWQANLFTTTTPESQSFPAVHRPLVPSSHLQHLLLAT